MFGSSNRSDKKKGGGRVVGRGKENVASRSSFGRGKNARSVGTVKVGNRMSQSLKEVS